MHAFRFRYFLIALSVSLAGRFLPAAGGEPIAGPSAVGTSAGPEQIQPDIVTPGMPPFSETWDDMLARDAAWATEGRKPTAGSPRALPRIRLRKGPSGDPGHASPHAGARVPDEAPRPGAPGLPPGDAPEGLPESPQAIGTNFNGINESQSGFIPPDSMGAVGPSHFVEMINGAVGIYNKTGTLLSIVSLNSFFTFSSGGINYPRNGTSDPHIRFDRLSDRWFACTLELGPISGGNFNNNNILLVVCRTNSPQTGTWDKYAIPVGVAGSFNDFDTFGLDTNGVYFGSTLFTGAGAAPKVAATPKAPLIAASPSLGSVFQFSSLTTFFSSPQPAQNHDAAPAGGRAWFVSSSTTVFANVHYRTLTWSGGVPSLSGNSILTTPAYGNPPDAPAMGSGVNIDVGDDRLFCTMIRAGQLWTERNVGTNATGGSTGINRTGGEWLQLNANNATATLVQSGRLYDTAASTPRYYYYPAVCVSGQGHMALGCSGSRSTEFVGTYASGRLASDPLNFTGAATLIHAGVSGYQQLDGTRNRWGDYSFTSVDPNDDMSLWTIQEYAGSGGNWGTWIARLLAPAPTLNNPAASGCAGQTGLVVPLTGTNFYDPGVGFANHVSVAISGTGVTVTNTTYNNPTSVNITADIAAGAAAGGRNITLTNPDGQNVTVTNGFTVTTGITATAANNGPVCTGGVLTLTGGPSGASTYSWTGPNGYSSSQQSPTVSNSATAAMAGTYTLTVTSGACSGMASTVVTINAPPTITVQPSSQTVCAGVVNGASFSVTASGSPAPTFQWQVSTNGGGSFSNIPGATSSTLTFTPVADANGKQYRCVVTNTCGSVNSNAATLTVNTAPTISVQPANQTVCAGVVNGASFSVTAAGTPAPTFQWQVSTNGGGSFSNIPGATSSAYSFTAQTVDNGNLYRAVVSNSCGSLNSSAATLTVNVAPTISGQPANQTVCPGTLASFSVTASGTPAPTFQWQLSTNGGATFSNIAGATSAAYSFTAQTADNGNQYRCVVTNSCGSVNSSAATLTSADSTAPVISQCAGNVMLFADANCQAQVPNLTGQVTANDNCTPSGSLTITQSPAAGTLIGPGSTVVTLTVRDASNNPATCQTTVTVTDNMSRVIQNCAPPQTISADANCQAALPDLRPLVAATDNCPGIAVNQNPAPGTFVGLGPTQVTLTVTDGAGNSASCQTTVTVVDNTPPSITSCAASQTISVGDGNCQAAVPDMTGPPLAATDNCGAVSFSQSPAAGTLVGRGPTTVTLTATDGAGNSASCQATVTVVDNTPPSITTCAADQTISTSNGSCQAAVPDMTGPPLAATDSCGSVSFSQSPAAGTLVGLGPTIVTLMATDGSGNTDTCQATLTVTDDSPPTITTCAADQTVAGSGDPCQAAVPDFTGPPLTASDNCSSVSFSQSPVAGTLVGPGDTNITITATDADGNASSCMATLHVTPCTGLVTIVSASPPNGHRDTLENTTPSLVPQGIGVPGTPNEGSVTSYGQPQVTFSGTPAPTPDPSNITVSCTGGTCPTVTGVSGAGPGPYSLTLSGSIPVLNCTTLTFAGTVSGVQLQYSFLPGDADLDGTVNTLDLLAIVSALSNGTANQPGNLSRYDIDRSGATDTLDLLRLVQLLNGVGATQVFNGSMAAACPP